MENLKRVIVDFKKLTPQLFKLLLQRYPDGYGDDDIISFKNVKGEHVEAVEVLTAKIKYLVKISSSLETKMANFEEEDFDDLEE